MADYQARKWSSWHHHMTLVALAQLFMMEERILQKDTYPLLSCSDIENLLMGFLPRRDIDKKELLRQMEKRHKKGRLLLIGTENSHSYQRVSDFQI